METHSSILAWRIPWTEQPGGLQSTQSHKSDMTEVTEHTHTQDFFGLRIFLFRVKLVLFYQGCAEIYL